MLYTNVSMLVGMTYVYLPFMVLPLYANLVKMDFRLLEAAYDLGASPFKAFWLVTVPLSQGRHHRRLHAGVHSLRGRVRDSFAAGRAGEHHDRPRGLGRDVHQQQLAARLGAGGGDDRC